MDDLDPTTMIVLAVIAVLLLKPDLLSGLLGGGAAPGPGYGTGAPSYVTLQPPPPASNPTRWPGDDGHAKPPTVPGSVHDADCPPGQVWNGLANVCMVQTSIGDPNAHWTSGASLCPSGVGYDAARGVCVDSRTGEVTQPLTTPGPGPAPTPPQPSPGAPTSVSEVKAAAKRAALFTPFAR